MKDHKAQILIVEDEMVIGMTIKNKLQNMGYGVSGLVDSWEDAAYILEKSQTDLVLLDIRIKGSVDGIELGRQIIEVIKIPVIFLTAHSDNITVQRAAQIQHSGYIVKPFRDEELKTTIEKALRKVQSA